MAQSARESLRSLAGLLVLALLCGLGACTTESKTIQWVAWSDDLFRRAQREDRFVLLDLGAVWCHWCHVMDRVTYHDPAVVRLIQQHFIAVKVDQDSRPDLANRYEDYGWPATIVFSPQGGEIVKRRGYIPPRPMAALLRAIIADPSPGPSVKPVAPLRTGTRGRLSPALRELLEQRIVAGYDQSQGGWGTVHKYLNWDNVEHCMERFRAGDQAAGRMARGNLDGALKLIDPIWGGIYQYSHGGDWTHPHYEKIMQYQAESMRVFALAHCLWGDRRYLQAARRIQRYLRRFLRAPEGAFYVSQDADVVQGQHSADYFAKDDAGRRAVGIPRVDKQRYSRENGWAICGLTALFKASGDPQPLADALAAARWVLKHRGLPGGGFRHAERDTAGPFLGDTLAICRAFLGLYEVTADRVWQTRAEAALRFIGARFKRPGGGFLTARASPDTPRALAPTPQLDENVWVVRVANRLYAHTGKQDYRQLARWGMRYLSTPAVSRKRGLSIGGVLLADRVVSRPMPNITIVGPKGSPLARKLFGVALRYPSAIKCVDWLDHREGPLANPKLQYPRLPRPGVFVCVGQTCASPTSDPGKLHEIVDRLTR